MVVIRLGAWHEVVQELESMVKGGYIDAFVVSFTSTLTGATIEKWCFATSPADRELFYEMLPRIMPACKEFDILGRETLHLDDRTLQVAKVTCNLSPSH